MAKLLSSAYPGFKRKPNESFDVCMKRESALLDEINQRSLAAAKAGKAVGTLLRFPMADGYALYVVTSEKPLTLQHVPFGDAWQAAAATIRGVTMSDVQAQIRSTLAYDQMNKKHESFYSSLEPGQIVHYHNGFGQYVRCEATRDGSKMKLKPIALVGNWDKFDLPRRLNDGSIALGYHAEQIEKGELFEPHESNIYEASGFVPNPAHKEKDPRKMEPISLEVPPMDAGAERLAAGWRAVQDVRALVNSPGDDPFATLRAVEQAAAKGLKELERA
jgi:hypothetical protein